MTVGAGVEVGCGWVVKSECVGLRQCRGKRREERVIDQSNRRE